MNIYSRYMPTVWQTFNYVLCGGYLKRKVYCCWPATTHKLKVEMWENRHIFLLKHYVKPCTMSLRTLGMSVLCLSSSERCHLQEINLRFVSLKWHILYYSISWINIIYFLKNIYIYHFPETSCVVCLIAVDINYEMFTVLKH